MLAGFSAGSGSIARDALAPNVDRADAERRADPFVEVDPDEIGIEVGQAEIELSDAVRRIDERIDPALARDAHDFGDRQDQPGAVTEMRQQDHLDRRVGLERAAIGLDQRLVRRGFRKGDLDHAHAAPCCEQLHAVCMLS